MVLILSITALALAAVSTVSGLVIPRKDPPAGYNTTLLEDYKAYHKRYLRLDCEAYHNTTFFDQCCHPRLANETSVPLPPQCGCRHSSSIASSPYSTPVTPLPTYVPPPPQSQQPEPSSSTPSPTPVPAYVPQYTPQPEPSSSSPSSSTPSPTPTPAYVPQNTPQPDPSPTTSSTPESSPTPPSSGNGDGTTYSGDATFFYQGGVPGACGQVHSDSDFICAMDQDLYGNAGNASPLCGKQVVITNTQNGKTVTVTVADDCPTCNSSGSIDLSVAAFDAIADPSQGIVPITWHYGG